jgi:2-dehydro-3-deoxygluconokinase
MALSDSSRRLVVELAARAHARGVRVTFDPNYRPALWDGPGAACAVHRELFEHVDWYLCGQEEGHALFGTSDLDELLETQHAAGLRQAVVRVGARGAVVSCQAGRWHVAPRRVEEIVDEIGAGDGYAAGFAYGLLQGWEPPACAHAGNLIAASALRGTGDWETYPRLPEVDDLLREAAAARA